LMMQNSSSAEKKSPNDSRNSWTLTSYIMYIRVKAGRKNESW
jgi:hypothetical protein